MSVPTRLTRDFATGMTRAEFKNRFPYLDPDETKEGFLNYHISKGDVSHDWRESFLGFADYRNRRVRAERAESKGTDSMGLPLDARKRATIQVSTEGDYGTRFLHALERHLQDGLDFDTAHAATIAELEGDGA